MAHVTFTVSLPSTLWVQQISTTYPALSLHVLAAVPDVDSGFALLRITGSDVSDALAAIDRHPQITDLNLVQVSENEATVHLETTVPLLLFSSRDAGLPLEFPATVRNGQITIDVTGSRDRLSTLADTLEQFGLEYEVEHVRERLHGSQLLTDRQQELVLAAVENGYYDTPRQCSLTELAAHLGIAKSTCSETLHRAEEVIVKEFVADLSAVTEPARSLEDELESS